MNSDAMEPNLAVELRNPHCPWAQSSGPDTNGHVVTVWTRGQVWQADSHLQAQQMADTLRVALQDTGVSHAAVLRRAVERWNGHFAAVIKTRDEIHAAVDRSRSIPLFYGLHSHRALLSDDASRVRAFVGDRAMDPEAVSEFLLTGYVTGSDTLYPNVKQIRPGEMISVRGNAPLRVDREWHWRFVHTDARDEPEPVLRRAMSQVFEGVFERFVRSLRGKRIVVPLSGGFDSRLIVAGLKRAGARDVVCFSYGVSGNRDSLLSQQVAQKLGFKWHFVPYTRECWRTWYHSSEGCGYRRYASGLCSLAHFQEGPALQALTAAKVLLPGDDIAPGHSPIGGRHIPVNWLAMQSLDAVVKGVLDLQYVLWKWAPGREALKPLLEKRVRQALEIPAVHGVIEAGSSTDIWEAEGRQARFIVNSMRSYECLGYGWRLPICDHDVWDFDATVPLRFRADRRLYESCLLKDIFPSCGLDSIPMAHCHTGFLVPRERIPAPVLALCRDIRRVWLLAPDPRLASFTWSDRLNAWRDYHRRFGHGGRSLERLVEINTMAAVHVLQEMIRQETGGEASCANQRSQTAVA
jgi:asparagine synthase (glutamine-hydrolysing)